MYSIISRDWAKLIPRAGSGDAPLATKAPYRWGLYTGGALFILRKRVPHAALLPLDPPMASSSNTPARLRSFHVALARSIASAAAFVSAAENPPVDANGPGARMPTTSSTCRSSPPPRLPLGAPRRSAPATDDAIPRTRDRTPPDILTGRASERRATHSLTRSRRRI